jgi:hypothetical protein
MSDTKGGFETLSSKAFKLLPDAVPGNSLPLGKFLDALTQGSHQFLIA